MLKAADALLEPDPRHSGALRCDAETGNVSPHLHGGLPQGTPDIIRLCADFIERLFAAEP